MLGSRSRKNDSARSIPMVEWLEDRRHLSAGTGQGMVVHGETLHGTANGSIDATIAVVTGPNAEAFALSDDLNVTATLDGAGEPLTFPIKVQTTAHRNRVNVTMKFPVVFNPTPRVLTVTVYTNDSVIGHVNDRLHFRSANTPNGRTLHPVAGKAFTGVVASFSSPPGEPPSIDWGDGALDSGTLIKKHHRLVITGAHTYAAAGQYRVVIQGSDSFPGSLTDNIGLTTLAISTADVRAVSKG